MRIAIDARMIKAGSMHGIARYVFQLLNGFASQGHSHQFLVLVNRGSPLLAREWPDTIELVVTDAKWISFQEQWELPRLLKKIRADIFHAPSFVAPLYCPCTLLMTIHDLNHIVLSQFYTAIHQIYYRLFVSSCIRQSAAILTVSNFSRQEIIDHLHVPPNKVQVTYNGVSENYVPVTDERKLSYIRDLYELPERFLFCVSNNKPHKNIHQLVRAFCHADIDVPLVLATPVDRRLIRIAEHYGRKHLLYFTKYIDEDHLPTIYSMTDLFVYPSTYEGFGLPPLEALSCGAPVVVASSSSLPEVVGNNAIFANPYDYEDIAAALYRGLNDPDFRRSARVNGIEHARKFSWDDMCYKTLQIYEQAATVRSKHRRVSGVQAR